MALLVLEPGPVNAPGWHANSLRVRRNLAAERRLRGLSNVEERVRIGAALAVSTAVVGASCATATLTSEGREALAFASGSVAQTTSTTLLVYVLVVEGCVFSRLELSAIWGPPSCGIVLGGQTCRGWRVKPILLDVGRGKTHGERALELRAVGPSETRFTTKQSRGGVFFKRS
jgi:F0F1-type ATP synthase membrane subunit c/vacuolar-type H+-ATPase subunit K